LLAGNGSAQSHAVGLPAQPVGEKDQSTYEGGPNHGHVDAHRYGVDGDGQGAASMSRHVPSQRPKREMKMAAMMVLLNP
jgi:hypothetical protein